MSSASHRAVSLRATESSTTTASVAWRRLPLPLSPPYSEFVPRPMSALTVTAGAGTNGRGNTFTSTIEIHAVMFERIVLLKPSAPRKREKKALAVILQFAIRTTFPTEGTVDPNTDDEKPRSAADDPMDSFGGIVLGTSQCSVQCWTRYDVR